MLNQKLELNFNNDGLIPCITIDIKNNKVLMLAWMNEETLNITMKKKIMHYWSRSRKKIWLKGEQSGQKQKLIDIYVDCDQDTILAYVELQENGYSCHTGNYSCFYRKINFKKNILEEVKIGV